MQTLRPSLPAAASGLGEATARAFAAKGAKVAIFDLQEEKGKAVAADIGGIFCEVNVTSDESVDAGFAKAREAHGQERILVNCAGTGNAIKTASRDKQTGRNQAFPAGCVQLDDPDQSGRHVPLHRQIGRRDDERRSA